MTEKARDILKEWKSGTVFKVPSGYLMVRASDVHALLRELEEDGSGSLLEVMYQRLQDENERLRGVEASNIALTSINNRLRDLARDMHRWMGRAVYDGSVREYEYRDFGLVLRELGIDADDEDGYEVEDD